ncbi:hypothetical protein MSG28_013828 [Choristoneura fumiferana]|uniref:Uncharacterized protein n=1 Tax=Choristoneura fumiferana TaxID=7141 RepID=A0ACC0K8X0_CHOFU|nr:hypothetical protein MSG28_013828 [Choristoneura fumiferana]
MYKARRMEAETKFRDNKPMIGPEVCTTHDTVCMPILAYGTAMGWISPHRELLIGPYAPSEYPASEEHISWMASIMFIFAPIALGWTVKLLCAHPIALIGARALIGFGSGGAFVVCPLYVKEISEDSIRGMTGTFETARVLSWLRSLPQDDKRISEEVDRLIIEQTTSEPKFSPKLLCKNSEFLKYKPSVNKTRIHFDERYLVVTKDKQNPLVAVYQIPMINKRRSEYKENITTRDQFRGPRVGQLTFDTIQIHANELMGQIGIADKTAVKAFWVALIVNLVREFCGCIAVLVYASHIFREAGKDENTSIALSPNKQSILLAAVQIVGSFLACQLVDRPLLAVTSMLAGFSMCLLGVWFYLQSIGVYMPGWVPIVALCVSIFADASGLQPLPFLRGTVATLIMAISLGTDFALLKLFTPLTGWIGYHSTFWVFSVICLSNVFYLILCVPETKMRKLEDIYADLQGKKRKKEENVVESNHV